MRRFRAIPLLCAAILAAGAGCERRALYEYIDEPYLSRYEALSLTACERRLRGFYQDDKELALRALARRALQAGEGGRPEEQKRLAGMLMRHYEKEHRRDARSLIVQVCIRDAGCSDGEVGEFLRQRIAEGDCVVEACQTLTALRLPGAREAIEPLLLHPRPDIRYGAALTLADLADPKIASRLASFERDMISPPWPETVCNMPLAQCRGNLKARIEARYP
ncbi:MAG: HEAT repeat domain-containing protein [Planctomycetota bacterium]